MSAPKKTVKPGERCDTCRQIFTEGVPPARPVYKLDYNGRTFLVPALKLGSIEALAEDFEKATGKGSITELIAPSKRMFTEAIRRNYPELSDGDIEEMLDFDNMFEILEAITGRVIAFTSIIKAKEANPTMPAPAANGSGAVVFDKATPSEDVVVP
jgi:hypothetical protein